MRFLSSKAHTIIGLIVGIALIAAPWLFGFTDADNAAVATPIVIGIIVIISELVTTSMFSPLKLVPMRVHLVIDYIIGAFLALSPWLLGFADEAANAWVPHVIVGIVIVLYALLTNPAVESTESALD